MAMIDSDALKERLKRFAKVYPLTLKRPSEGL